MAIPRDDIRPANIACDEVQKCMINEVCQEGFFGNCRWIYYPEILILGIASKSNFDRWANSRVIEISPTVLDSGDPSLLNMLTGLELIFKAK